MRSLDELNTSLLTPDARSALSITFRIESDGDPLEDVLAELGIDEAEYQRRVQQLAHEWTLQGGATVLPPLSAEEYAALRDSIQEVGQLYDILRAPAHENWIVDGNHRERACHELGIEPRYRDIAGTRAELESLALVVNLARRQLTAGARRGVIKEVLLRDPSRSDRGIANTVGVSPSTVGSVRRELEAAGEVSRLDTRRGRDGVQQPASKPARPAREPVAAAESTGIVDVTLRIREEMAGDLRAGWMLCSAIKLTSVAPDVYVLEVRR